MYPRVPTVLETFWWRWTQLAPRDPDGHSGESSARAHPRPLRRTGFWSRVGPFVAVGVLSLALLPLQADLHPSPALWLGVGLIPAIVLLGWVLPWQRWSGRAQVVLPLVYVLIVALLRDATGAAVSPFGPLALIVVVWFALYGTTGELILSLAAIALMFCLPVALVGAPSYPPGDLLHGGVFVLLGAFVGGGIHRLVAQLGRAAGDLQRLAGQDPLTALSNRRAWDDRLHAELGRARRNGTPLSLALIDLDDFKAFNDRYGHVAGDRLLQGCARTWSLEVRAQDVLARMGGDEFAVLLPDTGHAQAKQVLQRLRETAPGTLTCSVGVAEWNGVEDAAQLTHRADQALYSSKDARRNTVPRTLELPPSQREDESLLPS